MEINDVGQILGAIAVVLGFLSYQVKTQRQLLLMQTATCLVFCVHYLLIGATVGMVLNAIGIVRNVVYYFRNQRGSRGLLLPILFALVLGVAGILTGEAWYSVFSVLGLVINTLCLSFSNPQKVRMSILVTSPMVLTYDVFAMSVGGIVYESVAILSSLIGIVRNWKGKKQMKTTVYLIRHGESEANERNVFLGHGDLDLTELGREQAGLTAAYLKDVSPDAIYSSDLKRAYETARRTAEVLDMPIIKCESLREIDAGEWDERAFSALALECPDSYGMWLSNIGRARCDGGESAEELQRRIVAAVATIANAHQGGVVLVFTHATPIRAIAAHCLKKSLDEWQDVPWASNASVTRIFCEGDSFRLAEYSIDSFMGERSTKLPENV